MAGSVDIAALANAEAATYAGQKRETWPEVLAALRYCADNGVGAYVLPRYLKLLVDGYDAGLQARSDAARLECESADLAGELARLRAKEEARA